MDINESGEKKKEKSRVKYYVIVAVLVVGLVFGSLFASGVDVLAWFGNGESQSEVDQITGESGFEQLRPQLELALRQEKEQEIVLQHLNELRDASDIVTNLDVLGASDMSVVVAIVNGEKIKREEMMQLENQEIQQIVMMGLDPEGEEVAQLMEQVRPQILDNLIANAVLSQKMEEEGIVVSEAQVEEYYQQYVAQYGGEEILEQQLAQAGLTKDDLKDEIMERLPIQTYLENYLEENLSEDDFDFSDEELKELYEIIQQQQMQQQPVQ